MNQPTKTRPGDQPLPTAGAECVQDALIALIEERKQLGIQRYGSPLMTHNGRDAGRDAVEEALDLTVYSMQVAMELRDLRAAVARVRQLCADPVHRFTVARADVLAALNSPPETLTPADDEAAVPPGRNAEDCPRCTGTNPPYPFICPGHPAEIVP